MHRRINYCVAITFFTILAACATLSFAQQPATRPTAGNGAGGAAAAPLSKGTTRPSFQIPKVPINPALPTLWIIGDSTVRNGTLDNGNNGQWGWGNPIRHYFDETKLNVQNRAVGGTSSRSFYLTHWQWIIDELKPGDFVIMQFGHNDGGGAADSNLGNRSSIGGNGEETANYMGETVHTYGWYLRRFVSDAHDQGVEMSVVCSPIPRNRWLDGGVGIARDKFATWAREAAVQKRMPFIDLNELVIDQFVKIGQEKVTATYFPEGEATHPDWAGAVLIAETVVDGLKRIDSPLVKFLKPIPPTDLKNPSGRAR